MFLFSLRPLPFDEIKLVLKHRQGKNHKMRIVVFVGSPISTDENDLVKLAKKLKKEKVNVDIVSFGDHVGNNELLTAFVNTLNGKDGTGSHLISVPRGSVLSEALITSPIIQGEDGQGAANLGGAGFEFGFDPNEDPELALVKLSFFHISFDSICHYLTYYYRFYTFRLFGFRWKNSVNVKKMNSDVHWPNQIQVLPVRLHLVAQRRHLQLNRILKRQCCNVLWPFQLRLR